MSSLPGASAVDRAFAHCEQMARSHYENFPVASLLIPRARRPFVFAVYAFARTGDDMADEGSLSPEERLQQLDAWEARLDACYNGNADHPVFIALAETARRTGIPRRPLADLLKAFRMDVTRSHFDTFDELLGYCSCSANPVGQLVLHIFNDASPENLELSDRICTGLQLVNFWQDVSIDLNKGRVYLPLEDLARFDYTEHELDRRVVNERFRALMRFEVDRARSFLLQGAPLVRAAARELRFELALTVGGGNAVLGKIERWEYDVLSRRPSLSFLDKSRVFLSAAMGRVQ